MKLSRFALGITLSALFGLSGISQSEETRPAQSVSLASHHPKIESALEALAQRAAGAPLRSQAIGPRQASYYHPEDQTVRVIIEPEGQNAQAISEAELQAVGARVERRSRSLLRVRLPLQNLRALAERVPNIRFIRRPLPMIESRLKVSEGVVASGATVFHSQGLRGQHVRIAVIDLGFAQLSKAKRNRELPPEVIVDEMDYSGFGLESGTAHGTAVAEIVHDMAPDAWLYLKRATDEAELEQAVEDAIAQGVRIINYSVGVANSNFNDGTGIIAEIADRARALGVLWVNAAGNHAQSHWMGSFTDTNRNGWHEFLPDQEWLDIHVQSFFPMEIYLTWDAWPVTSDDFDLFLYDAAGRRVARSENLQAGSEPPTEEIEYMPLGVGVYRLKILARRVRTEGLRLNLFVFGEHRLEPFVPEGSLLAPADARGVLAVGAIAISNWPWGPQQEFSSQGPTADGRIKPDLSGPDQVRNWTLFNFGGTSAAAPHVAGAAALLLSRYPDWSADELQQFLEASAVDLGQLGKDLIYGAGRLELSFGPVAARRAIQDVPGALGREFLVEITVQMPIGLFGAVELIERLPEGFFITPLENDGARFQTLPGCPPSTGCGPMIDAMPPYEYAWLWALGTGESRKIRYRLQADTAVSPGVYALHGSVNGEITQGETQVHVRAATSSNDFKHPVERTLLPRGTREAEPVRLLLSHENPRVRFQVQTGAPARLHIAIYDLSGRLLFSEERPTSSVEFNGLDRAGRPLPNGVYFYVATLRDREGRVYQSRLERLALVR